MRLLSGCVVALTAAAAFLGAAPVCAQARVVGLRFEAPAACPDRAAFVREVAARTDRVSLPQGDDARVSVRDEGGAFVGVLRSAPGAEPREVRAARCEEIVRALALIFALAYDPEARVEGPASPSDAGSTATSDASATTAPAKAPAAPVTPIAPPSTPAAGRWRIGAGAHGELWTLSFPTFGARLFASATLETPGVVAVAGRLSGARTFAVDRGSADGKGSVRLVWSDIEAELCPIKTPGLTLVLRACGLLALTIVEATPAGRANVTDRLRIGASTGVVLPLTWFPIEVLGFELRAALVAPFRRDRFYFDPDATAFSTPALLFRMGVGVIVRFP